MKPFKIRDVEISPPLVLSPMAGVTDVPFRALLKRRGGIGLTVSEFISVEGLTRNNPKSKRQMRFYDYERPFAVQIFGGQPERMRMAAEMAEECGADMLRSGDAETEDRRRCTGTFDPADEIGVELWK